MIAALFKDVIVDYFLRISRHINFDRIQGIVYSRLYD